MWPYLQGGSSEKASNKQQAQGQEKKEKKEERKDNDNLGGVCLVWGNDDCDFWETQTPAHVDAVK